MSYICLLLSGAALLINGLGILGRVPSRDAGVFNVVIGTLQLVIATLIASAAAADPAAIGSASGVFLFGSPTAADTEYELPAARLRPLLVRIADGASRREQEHELPRKEIRALISAGSGALGVPVSAGGFGAPCPSCSASSRNRQRPTRTSHRRCASTSPSSRTAWCPPGRSARCGSNASWTARSSVIPERRSAPSPSGTSSPR